jgi:hypothetical protein
MPPLTPNSVLHTLFQGHMNECMQLVDINPMATRSQCISATMLLAFMFDINIYEMSGCLQRIVTECCIYGYGLWYIRNCVSHERRSTLVPLRLVDVLFVWNPTRALVVYVSVQLYRTQLGLRYEIHV